MVWWGGGDSIKNQLWPIPLQALQRSSHPPLVFHPPSPPPSLPPTTNPLLLCKLPLSFQTHADGSNAFFPKNTHISTRAHQQTPSTSQIYCKCSFAPRCLMRIPGKRPVCRTEPAPTTPSDFLTYLLPHVRQPASTVGALTALRERWERTEGAEIQICIYFRDEIAARQRKTDTPESLLIWS